MKTLSQLATSVLDSVEKAQLEKQAKLAYINEQELTTETGKLLVKVAAQLRIAGSTNITYTDLTRFRKTYDV